MSDSEQQIIQAKRALRKLCAAERERLPLQQRNAAGAGLAAIGLGFACLPSSVIVSGYSAMGSEIDPLPLLERLSREGQPTCLPVVTPLGNPLVFRRWSPGQPLVPRTWGIREPEETATEVDPDVLLLPLLAFDRRGVRLGYGGGYYDRTLERLRAFKPVIAIGLAYSEQELAEVPRGRHDQRLDWVLTPSGPIRVV